MKKNELEEILESLGWNVKVVQYGANYWATGMRASIRIGGSIIYLFAGERPAATRLYARSRREILNAAENDILHTITFKRLIEEDTKTGRTKSVPGIARMFSSVAELGIQLAAMGLCGGKG